MAHELYSTLSIFALANTRLLRKPGLSVFRMVISDHTVRSAGGIVTLRGIRIRKFLYGVIITSEIKFPVQFNH